jgi:hypothetical protein
MDGLGTGEIFVYESALNFDEAKIEIRYDDSEIPDEERMAVYRCQKWNFGRRICNDDWEEITSDIDTIRNTIEIDTLSLSTFLIGYKKQMYIDANMEEEEYFLNDLITVLGVVEDEDQNPIEAAEVEGRVKGTDITFKAKTDAGGVFTVEFEGPSKEGTHEILLTVKKTNYGGDDQSLRFETVKSKNLKLIVPVSFKINPGGNSSSELLLANLGQTDFYDLKISIEGMPNYYTLFETEIDEIKADEEKRIPLIFEIPEDVAIQNYNGKVKVKYRDDSLEEPFVLSIVEEITENTNEPADSSSNLPSAKLILPTLNTETILISIFGLISVASAFWYKNKKSKKPQKSEEVKSVLSDIKKEIERDNPEKNQTGKNNKNEDEDNPIFYAR